MYHSRGMGFQESSSAGKDASGAGSQKSAASARRESTSTSVDEVFKTVANRPRQERDTDAFATSLLNASQRGATSEDNAVMYALIAGGVGLVLIAGIAIMAVSKKKPVSANKRRRTRR